MHERQRTLRRELDNWNQYLQLNPHLPQIYVRRGMAQFKLAQIDASIYDFDCAEHLDATITPYLWQRGLSYYFANQFESGANQFEVGLTINGHDAEQTIWHYLCLAKFYGPTYAKQHLFPIEGDRPPTLAAVHDLYAGDLSPEHVLTVGKHGGDRGKFYSHFYVGLYYDIHNQTALAYQHITQAITDHPIDDYMWYVAMVHQVLHR